MLWRCWRQANLPDLALPDLAKCGRVFCRALLLCCAGWAGCRERLDLDLKGKITLQPGGHFGILPEIGIAQPSFHQLAGGQTG